MCMHALTGKIECKIYPLRVCLEWKGPLLPSPLPPSPPIQTWGKVKSHLYAGMSLPKKTKNTV